MPMDAMDAMDGREKRQLRRGRDTFIYHRSGIYLQSVPHGLGARLVNLCSVFTSLFSSCFLTVAFQLVPR